MDKERYHKEISEIDVPQSEIFHAIDKGITRGRTEKKARRKSRIKLSSTIAAGAATFFLAAGFVFAPVSYALSTVPLLGSVYEKAGLQIGHELMESDLVTKLNKKATSNGIDITITSAYYDGNIIGVTFQAKGEKISLENMGGDRGPEAGYAFHLFDGKEQNQWSSTMKELTETEDGYIASMEFYNAEADLPASYSLPLTFTSITGVKGKWNFDIPVEQIPPETIYTDAKSQLESKGYSLTMESVVKGEATTTLNYKTTFPSAGEKDEIRIHVIDNKGNRLSKFHPNLLTTKSDGSSVTKDYQELFSSKISEDASSLTIQPEIVKNDTMQVGTMDQQAPFTVESNRFNYAVKVTNMEQNGDQIIVDYTIQHTDTSKIRKDIIQNFADFIQLIKSDNVRRDEKGELDRQKMLEHEIRSDQATVLDENSLHFQSIYTIENPAEFDFKNYSLLVPFATLSANEKPIKMEPIKVDLK
ncbi:DUF4179 domain-containing protein [Sediminibacillus dalangtanensis]|uniref:DUF4179 domain-containing protein n=1 Tax=Sediminibacillus dalangtanensis TaxID=2729421 RepID=A0ABX7W1I3_9BACI|nr:DUF4179 domain-containing protein [Sediminibacillus dalangtanensis]QTN01008.1 DUF4179 domain-containing protein [Sediminibacillus dalangtanensis]